QIIEGEVAAGDDELSLAHGSQVRVQSAVHLVGHGEDGNHTQMVRRALGEMPKRRGRWRSAEGARAPGSRASASRTLPDVETPLPECRLHAIDLALPDPFRTYRGTGGRAEVQTLAGGAQGVHIRRLERPQPQVLG